MGVVQGDCEIVLCLSRGSVQWWVRYDGQRPGCWSLQHWWLYGSGVNVPELTSFHPTQEYANDIPERQVMRLDCLNQVHGKVITADKMSLDVIIYPYNRYLHKNPHMDEIRPWVDPISGGNWLNCGLFQYSRCHMITLIVALFWCEFFKSDKGHRVTYFTHIF